MKQKRNGRGFTIIELIVVVMIIAALATITVLSIGSWRVRTATTEAKYALQSATSALKDYKSMNNGYPTGSPPALPTTYQVSSGVTVSYLSGDATRYCLRATSTSVSSVVLYITQTTAVPTTVACT